jgi:hypothetical protein
MNEHDGQWMVKRTDLEKPEYLGAWHNSFVWVRNREFALHFLTEEHANTLVELMVPPCEPVLSDEEIDDLRQEESTAT